MKHHFAALSLCVVWVTLTGCAAAVHSPVFSPMYTNVKAPLVATGKSGVVLRSGSASATSFLGIAAGDASIRAAARAGGITEIHYVDFHSKSVLGIYAKYTTTVYGNGEDVSFLLPLLPGENYQTIDGRSKRVMVVLGVVGLLAVALIIGSG